MHKSSIFFLLLFHLKLITADDVFCKTGDFNPLSRKSKYACYKLFSTPKKFDDAQKFCKSLGGSLAEDVNKDDSSLYSSNAELLSLNNKEFWIGASNSRCNFGWNSGGSIEFNDLWAKDSRFYGVSVERLSIGGLWHTTPTGHELPFVCTFESSKNSSSSVIIPPAAQRTGMRAPARKRVKPAAADPSNSSSIASASAKKTATKEEDLDESMNLALASQLSKSKSEKQKKDESEANLSKKDSSSLDSKNSKISKAEENSENKASMNASLNKKSKSSKSEESNAQMSASMKKSSKSKSEQETEDSMNASKSLSASMSKKSKSSKTSEDSMDSSMSASMSKKSKSSKTAEEEANESAAMSMSKSLSKKSKSSTSDESNSSMSASMSAHSKKKSSSTNESESSQNMAMSKSMSMKKKMSQEQETNENQSMSSSMSKKTKSKSESESEDEMSKSMAMAMSMKKKSKSESESESEANSSMSMSKSSKSKSKSESESEKSASMSAQMSKNTKKRSESESESDQSSQMSMNSKMSKKSKKSEESESEANLSQSANSKSSKKSSSASESESQTNLNASKSSSSSSKKKQESEEEKKMEASMNASASANKKSSKTTEDEANSSLSQKADKNSKKAVKKGEEKEDDLDFSMNAARANELENKKKKPTTLSTILSTKPPTTIKPTTDPTTPKLITNTPKPPTLGSVLKSALPIVAAASIAQDPACPSEWTQFSANSSAPGICFKKYDQPMTFEEARMFCINKGGHLASIHNQKQLLLLSALLHNDKPNSIADQTWIGLNRIHQKYYVFEDETPMDFTRWLPGAPNINDCTVFTGNELPNYPHKGTQYKFGDYPCEKKQKSVLCEVTVGNGKDKTVPSCANGWSYYSHDGSLQNGKCYKQIVKETKFEDARLTCKNEDAYVATVQNLAESRFVSSLLETSQNNSLSQQTWIGLVKYKDGKGEYEWEDDHKGIQFDPWTEKLPKDKNCAVFTGNEIPIDCKSKFRFVSVDCHQKQRAVLCQKPPTTTKGAVKFSDTHNSVRPIG